MSNRDIFFDKSFYVPNQSWTDVLYKRLSYLEYDVGYSLGVSSDLQIHGLRNYQLKEEYLKKYHIDPREKIKKFIIRRVKCKYGWPVIESEYYNDIKEKILSFLMTDKIQSDCLWDYKYASYSNLKSEIENFLGMPCRKRKIYWNHLESKKKQLFNRYQKMKYNELLKKKYQKIKIIISDLYKKLLRKLWKKKIPKGKKKKALLKKIKKLQKEYFQKKKEMKWRKNEMLSYFDDYLFTIKVALLDKYYIEFFHNQVNNDNPSLYSISKKEIKVNKYPKKNLKHFHTKPKIKLVPPPKLNYKTRIFQRLGYRKS